MSEDKDKSKPVPHICASCGELTSFSKLETVPVTHGIGENEVKLFAENVPVWYCTACEFEGIDGYGENVIQNTIDSHLSKKENEKASRKFRARCMTCGGIPKMVKGIRYARKKKNLKEKHKEMVAAKYETWKEKNKDGYEHRSLSDFHPYKVEDRPGYRLLCECGNRTNPAVKKKSVARNNWNVKNGGWENAARWELVDKLRNNNTDSSSSSELVKIVHELKG